MKNLQEESLEPIARWLRFQEGFKHIHNTNPLTVVDIGCGSYPYFFDFLLHRNVPIDRYYAVDPLLNGDTKRLLTYGEDIILIKKEVHRYLPIPAGSADYVVGFAFLEHISNPQQVIEGSLKVLKPGGKALFTTPTKQAKSFLEILSHRYGLISLREITEHKHYLSKKQLLAFVPANSMYKVICYSFEFGLNRILVVEKLNK